MTIEFKNYDAEFGTMEAHAGPSQFATIYFCPDHCKWLLWVEECGFSSQAPQKLAVLVFTGMTVLLLLETLGGL